MTPFVAGIRAFHRSVAYDPNESYDWRRGWRHAEFSARSSLSPPPGTGRTLAAENKGAHR